MAASHGSAKPNQSTFEILRVLPLSGNLSGRHLLPVACRSFTVRQGCPQRLRVPLHLLEHVFPTARRCSESHCLCPVADVMAVLPESAAYCTLSWRGQAGEKYETCPGCASSYNKDCRSLLRFHLCAQQQHSILITQHLLCHSAVRERRRKISKARPKNKTALYVLRVLTSTQMTHFSISKGLRLGGKKRREGGGGWWSGRGRQQWSQSRESEAGYKSWRISLPL